MRRTYKQKKLKVLGFAKRLGLFRLSRMWNRHRVRILCYHGIWLGDPAFQGDAMFMRASTFLERLNTIQRLNYPVVPLSSVVDALRGKRPLPPDSIVITIDDGWYSTLQEMVPALRRRGMPATLYCDTRNLESGRPIPHVMMRYIRLLHEDHTSRKVGEELQKVTNDQALDNETRLKAVYDFAEQVGVDVSLYEKQRVFSYMSAAELRVVSRAGIDVQLHSHSHSLHDFSPGAIADELEQNRRSLGRLLDREPSSFQHFCYPSGVHRRASAALLDQHNVLSSTTTVSGIAAHGSELQFLPRLLDGDNLSLIEFEAELCGFMAMVRSFARKLRSFASRSSRFHL